MGYFVVNIGDSSLTYLPLGCTVYWRDSCGAAQTDDFGVANNTAPKACRVADAKGHFEGLRPSHPVFRCRTR